MLPVPMPPPRIDELYRDERMVIVNKPSGLSVHKGWDPDPVNAVKLVRALTGRYVYPVHRLDRATSGCLVFAFDAETASLLQDHLRETTVSKRYLAVTRGVVPSAIRVDHPIPKTPKGERVPAITSVRCLGVVEERFSLIEACPETGRLHQIRRHLKHLSHPLVGDSRYGDGTVNRQCRERFGWSRLALHAVQFSLRHPHDGTAMSIFAPPPDDFREPVERMGFSAEAWAA